MATAAVLGLLVAGFARIASATGDAAYFNGKIVTLDAAGFTVSGVAVKDGKILKVCSLEEMKNLTGTSTRLSDLDSKSVVPGLIDAHCHPMESKYLKDLWADCRYPETKSIKQALANIAAWAKKKPKGEWIFLACVSANENKFVKKPIPINAKLDVVAPDNPVLLANGDHMCITNSLAIQRLGLKTGMGKSPRGGSVILDKNGEHTRGLADANPMFQPILLLKNWNATMRRAFRNFGNQNGFTSLLAITPAAALPVLQNVAVAKERPTIRYTSSILTSANGKDMPDDLSKFSMPKGADPVWYQFAGIKDWADGENACRTGYMYET